jgi:nitroimidazol reductase NimA-like FMN-containing flavoprotein (pyridoxamine 5'-phosphate oxidase superfamily)
MPVDTPVTHQITELSVDECLDLLRTQSLGRLVYLEDGAPEIRPVNYALHQGSVVFRVGYGDLLDAVHRQPVTFEADHGDSTSRTGWSVIIRGIAEEIWRTDELDVARDTGLRPWAPGTRDHYVRIIPRVMTGRRIS